MAVLVRPLPKPPEHYYITQSSSVEKSVNSEPHEQDFASIRERLNDLFNS